MAFMSDLHVFMKLKMLSLVIKPNLLNPFVKNHKIKHNFTYLYYNRKDILLFYNFSTVSLILFLI